MDDLARAYATLGVAPSASVDAIRKSYKGLVRKWHPDRYSGDPQGQAEANVRMRAINDAFRSVVAARAARASAIPGFAEPDRGAAPGAASAGGKNEFGRRLTREEIDRIVEAMKGDGPFDWMWGDDADDPYYSTEQAGPKVLAGCMAALAVFPLLALADLLGLSEGSAFAFILGGCLGAYALLRRVLPRKQGAR